jgi:hypothetical protein
MLESFFDAEPSADENGYNIINKHLKRLRIRNYVTKATPCSRGQYWFNFYENRLIKDYIARYNKNFSLIVRGSDSKEMDFFAIPYPVLEPFLTPAFVYIDRRDGTRRWMFKITSTHVLNIRGGFQLDVSPYYGNLSHVYGLSETIARPDKDKPCIR